MEIRMQLSTEMTAALLGMTHGAFRQQQHLGHIGALGLVEGERDRLFGLPAFALLKLATILRNRSRTLEAAFKLAGAIYEPLMEIMAGERPADPPTYAVVADGAGFICDGPDELSQAVAHAAVQGAQTARPVVVEVLNLSAVSEEILLIWAVAVGQAAAMRQRIEGMPAEYRDRAMAIIEETEKALAPTKRKVRTSSDTPARAWEAA
jgi:hypothetical protein